VLQTKIIQLIAQVKDDQRLNTTLTGSSDLIDDAGLDMLQLYYLTLLLEKEFDINMSPEAFTSRCLSSLDLFTQCVAGSPSRGGPIGDQHGLQELTLQAIIALRGERVADVELLCERMFAIDKHSSAAYSMLSCVKYPGDSYIEVLSRLHRALRPATYVEIGVASGMSMARAVPPTLCVGIDPEPAPDLRFKAATKMFQLPSSEFFAQHNLYAALGNRSVNLGFIDGLHLFENVLDDFINLEHFCSPGGMLLLHDCLPLNEITASREHCTEFWTGDVWRILPVLAHFRPDLSIAIVKCAPSGLAMIRNLDPSSDVLTREKKRALAFGFAADFPDSSFLESLGIELVPNDWGQVARLLDLNGAPCGRVRDCRFG
jgi:acyl carrier protein